MIHHEAFDAVRSPKVRGVDNYFKARVPGSNGVFVFPFINDSAISTLWAWESAKEVAAHNAGVVLSVWTEPKTSGAWDKQDPPVALVGDGL